MFSHQLMRRRITVYDILECKLRGAGGCRTGGRDFDPRRVHCWVTQPSSLLDLVMWCFSATISML